MTDLEITRLCAEAMDLLREVRQPGKVHPVRMGSSLAPHDHYETIDGTWYDPLHDDAQAMALVKRMRIDVAWHHDAMVSVAVGEDEGYQHMRVPYADLNRAICLCVAQMQAAKVTA